MKDNQWSLYLQPGEEIVWEGAGDAGPLIQDGNRSALFLRWGICAVLGIAATVSYLPYALSNGSSSLNVGVTMAVIWALLLLVCMSPVQEWKTLNNHRYLLTNRRALTLHRGNLVSLEVSPNTPCQTKTLATGASVICIGEAACKSPEKELRRNAVTGVKSATNQMEGLVFYGVKNPEGCTSYLSPYAG